jgi:uncharacterized OB-fold protein
MEIPRHWRLKAQRYKLEGSTCPNCRQSVFSPRLVCPYCHTQPKLIFACELQVFSETKQLDNIKLSMDFGR